MNKNILILIFFNNLIISQSFKVVDSITKNHISFVNIKTSENNGTYSDENGYVKLHNNFNEIEISKYGYLTKKINISTIKDTVILSAKFIEIDSVIIKNKKMSLNTIKFSSNADNIILLNAKQEFLIKLNPNKDFENSIFKKISIKYDKSKELKLAKPVIRFNFYKNNEIIYSSAPSNINNYKKNIITQDLSDEYIILEKDVFIGIEFLGSINAKGEFIEEENNYFRPVFTDKKNKFLDTETYIKFAFSEDKELEPYWKILNSKANMNLDENFNLNLELVLQK